LTAVRSRLRCCAAGRHGLPSAAGPRSPPPAWLLCERLPLAIPLVVRPTVSLDVPSTDSAVLDYAPAGTLRALSANVNGPRWPRSLAWLRRPRRLRIPGADRLLVDRPLRSPAPSTPAARSRLRPLRGSRRKPRAQPWRCGRGTAGGRCRGGRRGGG